jgi:hypothetical protein
MNAINVISPYKHHGMWVFDDARVGLAQEPFVSGADTWIDRVVADIPNAENGFTLIFSSTPFPGHQYRLPRGWRHGHYRSAWFGFGQFRSAAKLLAQDEADFGECHQAAGAVAQVKMAPIPDEHTLIVQGDSDLRNLSAASEFAFQP